MTYDAFRENQRRDARRLLRLANAAVRVPEPRPWVRADFPRATRRVTNGLYPPPYSRREMEDWQ